MAQGRKRLLLAVAIFILISVPLILGAYSIYNKRPPNEFVKSVKKEVLSKSGLPQLSGNIARQLDIINNIKLSDKERFEALSNIAFFFSSEYSSSHDPSVRNFSKDLLGEYAKKEFPSFYNESLFNFPCADPTCGQGLSPEIKQVLKIIESSKISDAHKSTISDNLTTAGYMPDSNLDEKQYGLGIVIEDLLAAGNPQASEAAEILRDYTKKKYNLTL